MGNLIHTVYSNFATSAAASGQLVTGYGVHFPAVSVEGGSGADFTGLSAALHLGGAYTNSVRTGTADVQAEIERAHAACATTRFILAGYSQGAQAAGDALQRMPAGDRALVATAAFFGDPYYNADDAAADQSPNDPNYYGAFGPRAPLSSDFSGPVFSYCHDCDPICHLSADIGVLGVHVYVRNFARIAGYTSAKHESIIAEHET